MLCSTDADCGSGSVCVSGACDPLTGYPCTLAVDCRPPLTVCSNGTCELGCTSNSQCQPGSICTSGVCSQCAGGSCSNGCTSSSQCSNGEVCDGTTGQCRPCTSSADCGGAACQNGACQPPCTSASQCSSGQVCVSGVCGPCTSSSQCGSGKTCSNGTCQTAVTCPTWTGQVGAFMNNYCTGCHGSMTSQSSVQQDASRIQSSIDSGTMPTTSPYPSQTEITMIDLWFSTTCGMP